MADKDCASGLTNQTPSGSTRSGPPAAVQMIGTGSLGGKAQGLVEIRDLLSKHFGSARFPGYSVQIPRFSVIATDLYDRFMEANRLRDNIAWSAVTRPTPHCFAPAERAVPWAPP